MLLTKKEINQLTKETKTELLSLLYIIEDELMYKCKSISNTISYLQDQQKERSW